MSPNEHLCSYWSECYRRNSKEAGTPLIPQPPDVPAQSPAGAGRGTISRHGRSQGVYLRPYQTVARLGGSREFRHEDSPLDRSNHGSCSRYWQRLGGDELLLQNRPSLLVRAGFRHPTPRKSRLVKTDYRISVVSDRADACRRRAEDCERAASRVTDAQVRATYREMACRWREMAKRQQAIEKMLSNLSKPLK